MAQDLCPEAYMGLYGGVHLYAARHCPTHEVFTIYRNDYVPPNGCPPGPHCSELDVEKHQVHNDVWLDGVLASCGIECPLPMAWKDLPKTMELLDRRDCTAWNGLSGCRTPCRLILARQKKPSMPKGAKLLVAVGFELKHPKPESLPAVPAKLCSPLATKVLLVRLHGISYVTLLSAQGR